MGELVDELEGLGYLARTLDPADRRAKLISLTEAGRRGVAAGGEAIAALEREITDLDVSMWDSPISGRHGEARQDDSGRGHHGEA